MTPVAKHETDTRRRDAHVATIRGWLAAFDSVLDELEVVFKTYVEGLDRLPADGRFLLVGNHTGFAALETFLVPYEVRRQTGKATRTLADRNFGNLKGFPADLMAAYGAILGTRDDTRGLMKASEPIMVFPGGGRELGKGKDEPYSLLWGHRAGFAKLAVENHHPIITSAVVGAEEIYKVLTTRDGPWGRFTNSLSQRIAGRADVSLPLVRGVGPTLIPRPQRIYLRFSDPIDTTKPKGVDTDTWVATVREKAKSTLESDLADLQRIRETDPFRHLAPWAWREAVMPRSDIREGG